MQLAICHGVECETDGIHDDSEPCFGLLLGGPQRMDPVENTWRREHCREDMLA